MNLDSIFLPGIENKPLIIAGPCSAETEDQVMLSARQLSNNGIKIFRAGVWKPRTKPGGFEGVGTEGLSWLQKAKRETGMYVATEVATQSHVVEAVKHGIDVLWIGARTTTNPFAVQEIADTLSDLRFEGIVLIKNPVNPDLELWIGAIERIYNSGIKRLGVIHRGFSTYGDKGYRNEPQWNIPIELKRQIPNLPLILDPSHIGGKRELIYSLSQRALDLNYDGLMIESHPNPDMAWSDKDQQLTPDNLHEVLKRLIIRNDLQITDNLNELRSQIDLIDNDLLSLLSKRMNLSRQIGQYKKEHNMPVLQTNRYDRILDNLIKEGEKTGLSKPFVKKIWETIHEQSILHQIEEISGSK